MSDVQTTPESADSIDDIAGLMGGEADEGGEEESVEAIASEMDGGDSGEPEQQAQDDDDLEEIELNGKKFKAPKDVAKWRESHDRWMKNHQELDVHRKAAEQMRVQAEQVIQYNQHQIGAAVMYLQQQLNPFANTNWAELAQKDPNEYIKQRAAAEHIQSQLNGAMGAYQQLQQQQEQIRSASLQEQLSVERAALLERIPDWRDPKKASAEQAEIAKVLREVGYSDDELNNVIDHRAISVARDAMLYRKMMAQREQAAGKPRSQPVMRASANAGADTRSAADVKAAAQRLKANPNSIDALAGFVSAHEH